MEVDINTSKRNMSEINETGSSSRRNPLLWISLVIVGLILFVLLKGERGDLVSGNIDADLNSYEIESTDQATETDDSASTIEQNELLLPGKRARQYIERVREVGKPYPLEIVFEKAQAFRQEGNLADAHLLLFFSARENYLPAMMEMGEMSDPTRFQAAESLLDNADVVQAYKWYQKAANQGYQPAEERVVELRQWALDEAQSGNSDARQLLLNFK